MLPRDHRLGATPEPNILDVLAAAGRRAPDGLLVAAAALGLVAAVLPPLLWPAGWLLMLAGAAAAGFGLWGIADRTGAEWRDGDHPGRGQAVTMAGGVAAAVGVVAAVLFVLGMVYVALSGVIH